jgi:CRISPR-associated endonuclease Csn1
MKSNVKSSAPTTIPTATNGNSGDLQLAFDVGHSSIGWAVLQAPPNGRPDDVNLLGCGAVTFRADDCLASSRRAYRRQRRHIRATRQRIRRLKALLLHLGVLTQKGLDKPGCAWPWLLAARVLKSSAEGKPQLLTWAELWDVLRWYAHNRGYDGNRNWAAEVEAVGGQDEEDTEKVENARHLMDELKANSMAETVCAVSGLDPLGKKKSCNVAPAQRFKARNAAFPREVVEKEVRTILEAHLGKLKGMTPEFVKALMEDWRAVPCPAIKLPRRYAKGLLFGQLVPRFDNRIISKCPITGGKVPSRNCPEFLNFRWGMQLANIRVSTSAAGELRPLEVREREALDERIRKVGAFTAKELTDAVHEVTGRVRDNLETMLLHPDAKEALIVDPIQKKLMSGNWEKLFPKLPQQIQNHARTWLARGKTVTLQECVDEARRLKISTEAFESELALLLSAKQAKRGKKDAAVTRESVLNEAIHVKKLSMRAPYSRDMLKKAFQEVMTSTRHPKEEGGCLYITEEMRKAQLNRPIAQQTNNHLVRHRLLILERLLGDIVKEFAGGEKARVGRVTVEVNRDLRKMSGMTAKQKAQDLGLRLANHESVAKKLEAVLGAEKITAGLIRKARVAEDLGWVCPYTGTPYDIPTLVNKAVDKDHIVPYALRPTNSLESLVITFAEINKWKGRRTAMEFVMQEAGKPVPGRPNLTLTTPDRFKKFVEGLESFKGHDDDKARKKKRKDLLLLAKYEAKEFTPGDLTQTSQLVRLAAQSGKRYFQDVQEGPVVISLPGSVTGTVRKSWNLLGCLAQANPGVLEADGELKSKMEIRDITHLHHALDACVLGFASHFLPNDGRVWELLLKRNLAAAEEKQLLARGVFGRAVEGRFQLLDLGQRLKDQISVRLCEKRVVQHIPASMNGLRAEQNIWRVVEVKDGEATLRQALRGPDQQKVAKIAKEKTLKLVGVFPEGDDGKLKRLKGALVIPDNYGVALDPEPSIIPFHKVHTRLSELRQRNGGKPMRTIRNGQLISVSSGIYKGVWKVFSIKNNTSGMALDIGRPDVVRLRNKTEGHKINVVLATLVKNSLDAHATPLTGIPSH